MLPKNNPSVNGHIVTPTTPRAKCTRIGRGFGAKRGAVSPKAQAQRILENLQRRQATGEAVTLQDYQPTADILAELAKLG